MPTRDAATALTVLVPDDRGLTALADAAGVAAVRYEPGSAWPADHHDAEVVVVGYEAADAVGARFHELPALRLVQTLNAGYEQWLPYLPDGVILSNGRGAHGGSTAEWVVAVLLAIYRDLAAFAAHHAAGQWRPAVTDTLLGKRVVVLGAGDLATNLAARLAPFEVDVTLVGRSARPGVRAMADVHALLPRADVLVSMLPNDASTHHVVDAAFLAALPDRAIVVNAGRGTAVDPEALLTELRAGRLRAALDVTEPEPLPPDHPLWTAPGLLLTPHVAGSTAGAWDRAWAVARRQIEEYLRGDVPPNAVAGVTA